MKQIISVSRRSDIPAFYSDWFLQKLKNGFAAYSNSYGRTKHKVSLKEEDILAFVFWLKNYLPFFPALDELDKRSYRFYFNYTITGLPTRFETEVIETNKAIDVAANLANRYSKDHINWRYDPIILSDITDENFHIDNFESLCRQLSPYVNRCYFSFAQMYGKTKRSFNNFSQKTGIHFQNPDAQVQNNLVNNLVEIANKYNISMYSCSSNIIHNENIEKASCVDFSIIQKLYPETASNKLKKKPTRKYCGCFESKDIGAYNTCPHGCIYCYANHNKDLALKNYNAKDYNSAFLDTDNKTSLAYLKEIDELEKEKKQKIIQKNIQGNLFEN